MYCLLSQYNLYYLPSVTLSEVASLLSQKPTQLSTTMSVQGTYTLKVPKHEIFDGVFFAYIRPN